MITMMMMVEMNLAILQGGEEQGSEGEGSSLIEEDGTTLDDIKVVLR